MGLDSHFILDFSEIHKAGKDVVGKKAHELGILWKLGIPIPKGFVITADFFKEFLHLAGIDEDIKKTHALNHPAISDSADKLFQPIRNKIMRQHIPQILSTELHKFYRKLSGTFNETSLIVFSSSSYNKSIIFNKVKGDANLILKIKTIWSLNFENPAAIVVQENINSDIKGEVFTDNPTTDNRLTKLQMDRLIGYCNAIQKYFYFTKKIKYAVIKNTIFITKIDPFTGGININKLQKVLIRGTSLYPGIATGYVRILNNKRNDVKIKKGEIVVMSNLDPSIFDEMKNARAVIIESISQNSMDKTLFRNYFKIPAIEGSKNATRMFKDGNVITVNGMIGEVYSGGLVY